MASQDEPRSSSFALCAMAQASRQSAILMTAGQQDILIHLAEGPLSADSLAQSCQVPVRELQRWLNACGGLDLLEKEGESYGYTPMTDTCLVRGRDGYMRKFIEVGGGHYEAWRRLLPAIREDRPMHPHAADALDTLPPERFLGYVEGHYDLGTRNAVAIAERVDLSNAQQRLDIAGGQQFTRSPLPSVSQRCTL